MKKNPIKTRKYFIDRLIEGEWKHSDIPTSTLKDAEEIAKHMLGRNNVTQTRIISFKANGDKQIHRNYSHEGFIKNPKSHKNYFITIRELNKIYYFDGIGFTLNKANAAIFHADKQAIKVAKTISVLYKDKKSIRVEFE